VDTPRVLGACMPNSRFHEFNLDPALAEMVETTPAEQMVEGILRLEDPHEIPPQFTVVCQFNRICTGRFLAGDAWTIRGHPNVLSFKAARALGIADDGEDLPELFPREGTATPRRSVADFGGRGCIVAALDFGLDFAHPNFLNPDGTTRLVAFWHQGATYDPAHPNPYGYGRIFSPEEINAALSTPDPYGTLGYHPAISDTSNGSHGTHTFDIAAGNGRVGAAGAGYNAGLLFVHLSTPRLGSVGDLGDSVRLLEGLDFVDKTANGRPWVVNLSVGRTAGSHDGTSPVEQGMHELLRKGPGRAIVQSAGNYRSAHLAVEGWLRDGEHRDLEWIIDPADTTDNEIDAWYSGKDRFVIAIRPPQGSEFVEVKLGHAADIVYEGTVVGRIYHRREDPNAKDHNGEVFLYAGAPPGVWTVRLIGDYVISGRFHAWIERDLARPGAQSRFDPEIATQLYTLGTIATSPLVITVGAYDATAAGNPPAPFSSRGPTRDERRDKPELYASGVDIIAARSIPRDAVRQEGLLVPRSGTSMASPHVTGLVAAMYEAAGRPVSIEEIRDCLKRSAEPLPDREDADCWGRLNLEGAIREIRGLQEAEKVVWALPESTSESDVSDAVFDAMGEDSSSVSDEQFIEVRVDEGESLVNSHNEDYTLDRAELALASSSNGGRLQSETSFLQRLLRDGGGSVSVLGLSPARLFREAVRHGSLQRSTQNRLKIIAMPSSRPGDALRAGDWMIRAIPGTGDVGHVCVLASADLLTRSALASEGIPAESTQPGSYGTVIEGGAFPHTRKEPFARRFLDGHGRVPPYSVIVRPQSGETDALEDYTPPPWLRSSADLNRQLLEEGTATPVLRLEKVRISGLPEINLTLGSGGRYEGFFLTPIHLRADQTRFAQTDAKDIEVIGRVQMDESGTRRDYDRKKDGTDWPLSGVKGSVAVKIVSADGPSLSEISASTVRPDGAFAFTTYIGVDGYTRSLTMYPRVELKGGKQIAATVVVELIDLEQFLALVDPRERARPATQSHLEFLASVRKIYQGGPKDPLSGAFDQVLYRNRNVKPLVPPDSADEKMFKLSRIYTLNKDFLFADTDWVDIGHVLTGIEGSPKQDPSKGQSVPMPPPRRELIVTWAGDLGSALQAYLKDFWTALDTGAPVDLNDYLLKRASRVDLIGDIDGINIGSAYDPSLSLAENLRAYYGKKSRRRYHEFIANSKDRTGKAELPLVPGTKRPQLSKQAKQTIADHTFTQFLRPLWLLDGLYWGTDSSKRKLVDEIIKPNSREMDMVVAYFARFLEDGLTLEP